MLSGMRWRMAFSACTWAFVRGQTMESASKATMRRAMLSSLFDGGLPTLQLASSRLLATETINAAKIGELTASAMMQIMINITTTPLRASCRPPATPRLACNCRVARSGKSKRGNKCANTAENPATTCGNVHTPRQPPPHPAELLRVQREWTATSPRPDTATSPASTHS